MLEAELDEHLGYTKYDYKNKTTKRKFRTLSKILQIKIRFPIR
jgi:transposase-like protein